MWIIILSLPSHHLCSLACYSIPGHLLEQNKCFWVGWEAVRQVQLWASNDSQHCTVCNTQCEDNAVTYGDIDSRDFSALSPPQVMVAVCKVLHNCIVSCFIPCLLSWCVECAAAALRWHWMTRWVLCSAASTCFSCMVLHWCSLSCYTSC